MTNSKKIVSIVGARPQFIKLAPLSERLAENHEEIILHTGQHYDERMSAAIFDDLQIKKPKYNLSIGSGLHGAQTGKMLEQIEAVLLEEKPELVIVFGDTNSTLAGALAASKLGIKTLHIEAGLRSYNRSMPEEINRIATDHISDLLFVPTPTAMQILKEEGLSEKAHLTGDIMIDTVNRNKTLALEKANKELLKEISEGFYLLTLHRPYNVDSPEVLQKILSTMGALDADVVFPVHPRTRKMMAQFGIPISNTIHLLEPCGYLDFLFLQSKAKKILTDSGGIQKEAYTLKKPCITLRPETEWVETVQEGWNLLMNPETDLDAQSIIDFWPISKQNNIFGKRVTQKMIEIIDAI